MNWMWRVTHFKKLVWEFICVKNKINVKKIQNTKKKKCHMGGSAMPYTNGANKEIKMIPTNIFLICVFFFLYNVLLFSFSYFYINSKRKEQNFSVNLSVCVCVCIFFFLSNSQSKHLYVCKSANNIVRIILYIHYVIRTHIIETEME